MDSNQDKILHHYSNYNEDQRAQESRSAGLEFHYTKKILGEYISLQSHVIEIGCATGYYGMFFAEKCARYTGVDLSPENISLFQKKIVEAGIGNASASVGDAMALDEFSDNSYDVVLCLGPMYHMHRAQRQKVFEECRRIARPGAIIAFAYINGIGAYVGACVNDDMRSRYPSKETNKYVFERNTDDVLPEVFIFTSPEEIECDAQQNKLNILKNCGVNFTFAASAINAMSETQFQYYLELADRMTDSPSCTGLSANSLLICKK